MAEHFKNKQVIEIPFHWVEAAKIGKKIMKDFLSKYTIDEFREWNSYKKYEYNNKGRYKFKVVMRHTKNWKCYCDWDEDLIKLNFSDDIFDSSDFVENTKSPVKDRIIMVLIHEITHYLQFFYNLGENLTEDEMRYYQLPNNGANASSAVIFLYLTNWIEMDADLSAIHYIKKYKDISKSLLLKYYNNYSTESKELAKICADYVYNYWWKAIKDFDFRLAVNEKKIKLPN